VISDPQDIASKRKIQVMIDSKTYITRWMGNQENERKLKDLQSGI
jgi:hypothetical protein